LASVRPGTACPRPGQRRADERQPPDVAGVGRGVQDRDRGAHRVAQQDDRLVDDLLDEAAEQVAVGAHGGRPARPRGAPVAGEVDRQHPVVLGQQRCEVVPVGVRAAEAVHGNDHRPVLRPAVVDPGEGAVQVSGALHRGRSSHGRVLRRRDRARRPGV
jgi:hypothetical protein